jgi:PAS domain S-box-containing protein
MDVVFISSVDGRFLDVNPAAEELFGLTLDELLSVDIKDLYYFPEGREKFMEAIERKGFVKNHPATFKKSDDTPIDCLISAAAIRAPDGNIVGYQGITKDISKLRKTQEQLFRAQKMEAIGTLTGGIAHDFNNILATILGYASFLKTRMPEDETVQKGLDAIEKSSVRAAELTSQLLSYTRMKTKEVTAIDLNRVIREVYRLISKTLEKSIVLRLNLNGSIPSVEGDETQLFQVIMNIAVNAQAAMVNGGTFTIETGIERVEHPIEKDFFTIEEGLYVIMRCTDTGAGMDRDTLMRVYEPYFTTRKKSGGSGLGMSVAFGIIKGHGGYIEIESELGKGTCVTILLPASERSAELFSGREAEVSGGSETIMIIDDEEDILSMTTDILGSYGYTVHTFNSGRKGIEAYADINADLVILDLKMPDMDGREVFAELQKMDPEATVLFATGYAGPALHREVLRMGARGYLEKPFVISKLLAKVREVLDG